ncbi:hypothetical protein [Planctomicrobium sp. SH527]|uniref:hypothetical protein n=1 Tax=Planctomicrobium sp. SH527 TaxID=3448123 RepID=UPI003F5C19D9
MAMERLQNLKSPNDFARFGAVTLRMVTSFVVLSAVLCLPSSVSAQTSADVPQRVYRDDDIRPKRDDAKATALGIRKYESKHLLLYSDIDPVVASQLPAIVDQAYVAWTQYFGELPPARDGSAYQITGYLMEDEGLFRDAGMQPAGFVMANFGRQFGREFWMREQKNPYYRRHLLIHEATHAFMTTLPSMLPPLWYLEGMAEFFGTHTMDENGRVQFGVFPQTSPQFPGLGRIEIIHEELYYNRIAGLHRLGTFTSEEFSKERSVPYSWSWAVCAFLENHPRYHDRFRVLGQHLEAREFQRKMSELFEKDRLLLSAEWYEFAQRVDYGFDVAANAFVPADPRPWPSGNEATVDVSANQGWQSTGGILKAGDTLEFTATGQVILNSQVTPPWVSEPQGITLDYSGGYPIGQLLVGLLPIDSESTTAGQEHLTVMKGGASGTFKAESDSELWFRVNDVGNGLKDNQGGYQVRIRRQSN